MNREALGHLICLALLAGACVWYGSPHDAEALPAGYAWAPVSQLVDSQATNFYAPRVDVDSTGAPYLVVDALGLGQRDGVWELRTWADTSWAVSVRSGLWAGFYDVHVLTRLATRYLCWLQITEHGGGLARLLLTHFTAGGVAYVDTALNTTASDAEYSAAATSRRRWAMRIQQRSFTDLTRRVRVLYSDTPGRWTELPELGQDEYHGTLAPVDSLRGMVVYAGASGLAWAIGDEQGWHERGQVDPRPWFGSHPRFRLDPGGGAWLAWSDNRHWVHVSHYRDGTWVSQDSVTAAHEAGQVYWPTWLDVSHDGRERPVVAWWDQGVTGGPDVATVAFPTETGWSQGEVVPGSQGLFAEPTVARDRNGDVWVAWQLRTYGGCYYTHSYCAATATTPEVSGSGRARTLRWGLSTAAPGSRWAVLRARNEGEFEALGVVEADSGTVLSWTDASPARGVVRYRVRREGFDQRFAWQSEEARWPARGRRLPAVVVSTLPVDDRLEYVVEGAVAGPAVARLFDIQGRVVAREEFRAGGTPLETRHLAVASGAGRLASGIYFLTVVDATGARSESARVIVIR